MLITVTLKEKAFHSGINHWTIKSKRALYITVQIWTHFSPSSHSRTLRAENSSMNRETLKDPKIALENRTLRDETTLEGPSHTSY